MKLSVIIPTYKDNERLVKCVECLEKQIGDQSVEILVVDNAGDPTLRQLLKKHPNTTYLLESMPGSYAARNAGLRVASGEIIAFTDSDCLPTDSWVLQIRQVAVSCRADVIAGRVKLFAQDPTRPNPWEISDMLFGFPVEQRIMAGGGGVTANLIVRRTTFNNIGLFSSTALSGDDVEWCKRARAGGMQLIYRKDIVVMHPARSTRDEHLVKARRVAGALANLIKAKHRWTAIASICLRLPVPPVRDTRKAWPDTRFSVQQKFAGLLARSVVHYYTKWQVLLYLIGPTRSQERR